MPRQCQICIANSLLCEVNDLQANVSRTTAQRSKGPLPVDVRCSKTFLLMPPQSLLHYKFSHPVLINLSVNHPNFQTCYAFLQRIAQLHECALQSSLIEATQSHSVSLPCFLTKTSSHYYSRYLSA